MRMQHGVILALMISTTAYAGSGTNTAAKATNPKAASPKASPAAAKKPAAEIVQGEPFAENESAAVKSDNLNVRGQARIGSEIITKLKRGDTVIVQKEVTIKPKADEPARWAQIALPPGTHVWVSTLYVDASQTVSATKLNIRSGAGENYSVVGTLKKGDAVKPISTKGDWTEIEAPTGSYGFVAAHMLAHKTAEATPIVSTPPTNVTAVVPETTNVVATATENPTNTTPATNTAVAVPVVPTPLPTPVADEPPARRIVQREGVVGDTVSIQAPTYYQLESLDTGRAIDYLYSTTTNLSLSRYKGRTVMVTGEEALDERWANTPVLTIQKIQLVK